MYMCWRSVGCRSLVWWAPGVPVARHMVQRSLVDSSCTLGAGAMYPCLCAANSTRTRQRQQRTARQRPADTPPVAAVASLGLRDHGSPNGSAIANKRQAGGFASGSGQSSGNLRRPQHVSMPYIY